MDDVKAKQQVVEKIKSSTSILVTVSRDPSVDALSAAIGLNLLLDKLEKHATTVFSGLVPPAIAFLEPEKILDDTTDSLRDFIIALDKEKADHLRYKVEGDSVKIFITPYKTTITSDDLEFSQGDYNVELVIALGVDNQDHLDGALEAHGQILHDATVIAVTSGDQTSSLGGIDWHDAQASSLSEMIAGLAEALKTDKNKSLLDNESSTALLTGIVAQTDRFSNSHTTSRVMTVASQLMGSGADQQLIASKLEEGIGKSANLEITDEDAANDSSSSDAPKDKNSLSISHKPFETLEEMDKRVKAAEHAEATDVANDALDKAVGDHTGNATAAGAYAFADDASSTNHEEKEPETESPAEVSASTADQPATSALGDAEPTLGGALNATTEQAAEDTRREIESDQNKTILTHAYLESTPSYEAPMNAAEANSSAYVLGEDRAPGAEPAPLTPPAPTTPADLGLPMPPPLPDFSAPISTPSVLSPAYSADPAPQPEILADILTDSPAPAPTTPPAPDFAAPLPSTPPASTPPASPGQFKIPGQ